MNKIIKISKRLFYSDLKVKKIDNSIVKDGFIIDRNVYKLKIIQGDILKLENNEIKQCIFTDKENNTFWRNLRKYFHRDNIITPYYTTLYGKQINVFV